MPKDAWQTFSPNRFASLVTIPRAPSFSLSISIAFGAANIEIYLHNIRMKRISHFVSLFGRICLIVGRTFKN